jgi:hypothetical protein
MASVKGLLVHQITLDYNCDSLESFKDVLNDNDFIMAQQYYRRELPNGEIKWEDRGSTIINTSIIGKVQEFVEYEREFNYDEPYQYTDYRRQHTQSKRQPLRPY